MKARVGLYHVSRNKGSWGVFLYTMVTETSTYSDKIEGYAEFEDAIKASYRLNGWNEPKNISKRN